MEFKVYGHAGRPMVVFPTSRGRFYQYEDSGAVAALAQYVDAGRIRIWTVDGIDGETFFGSGRDLPTRIEQHEAYFRYIREELLPEVTAVSQQANGGRELKPLFSGCSMGGFHAANFVFRFPTQASGLIALSGVYSTRHFFGTALEGQIYFNSPVDYLSGLTDEAILQQIRNLRLYFCCGQGRWEDAMLADTRTLHEILHAKQIPAWVDYWGHDVDHDWPWWHKQLQYFVPNWLEAQKESAA